MTTLGQIQVEIPGRKPDDPVMTQEEFQRAATIYFERCAGWVSVRDADKVVVYDAATYAPLAEIPAQSPSGIFFTARAHRMGL